MDPSIFIVGLALLLNLVFNYVTHGGALTSLKNKIIYALFWIASAVVLMLGYFYPENRDEYFTILYVVAGISLPQFIVYILTNKDLKRYSEIVFIRLTTTDIDIALELLNDGVTNQEIIDSFSQKKDDYVRDGFMSPEKGEEYLISIKYRLLGEVHR